MLRNTLYLATAYIALAAAAWASGPKETVLYSFQSTPDGEDPSGRLAMDEAGNLYGTTWFGGTGSAACEFGSCGTVFQLAPPLASGDSWTETVLYNFQGRVLGDGNTPTGGLIWGKGDALYGVTAYGGTGPCLLLGSKAGCGTVYELSPPAVSGGAWTESVIYSFQGDTDGYFPTGELVSDQQGNLYGATYFGGGLGQCDAAIFLHCGMVFELSPPAIEGGAWEEKVLYSFGNGPDGSWPNGSLILDSKGALYGTTQYGGTLGCASTSGKGCGVVFKLTPPRTQVGAWTETVLHSFSSKRPDGAAPVAGLIFDKLGNLYGTTYGGGDAWPTPAGTVFELSPPTSSGQPWTESILLNFGFGRTGGNPSASLTFDSEGNLYGTTSSFGASNAGTAFTLKPPSIAGAPWTFDVLYAFERSPDSASPSGPLVFGSGGGIFGVAAVGGTGTACGIGIGCGTVYEITP